jgi:methyltransferase (TIGR00027 family)
MAASKTAAYVALYRALETRQRARPALFRDPYALRFLPLRYQLLIRAAFTPALLCSLNRYADKRAPGARTSAIARTLFIDDVVRAAVARGVRQCVLLGAGFDCRAHRMPELSQVHVFEVDQRDTQRVKQSRVPSAGVH